MYRKDRREIRQDRSCVAILTSDNFLQDKRDAVHAYARELTGERVGPYGVDQEIVPYILELNAIPGVYSWASCAGHTERRAFHGSPSGRGFVWVRLAVEPADVPTILFEVDDEGKDVKVVYPFQDDQRKVAFEFEGGKILTADMALVLEYLWRLAS